MNHLVHFIHVGGEWCWQHWRAVERARRIQAPLTVEGASTIIWTVDESLQHGFYDHHIELRSLSLPDWLREHLPQHAKDLMAWRILYEHGGMYLDLDTISLRPAWDLLPDDADLLVSREYHPSSKHPDPFNVAVMIARPRSEVVRALAFASEYLLRNNAVKWGTTGPRLLTAAKEEWPDLIYAAPYRALNGWSYHDIGDYYARPRDPGEETRVIHLYSSDHLDEFYADRWMP